MTTKLRRFVAVTFLLSHLCDVTVVVAGAYTPSNFYPPLSGSPLFHPRGRSPSRQPPRDFAVQPRTQGASRGGGGGGGGGGGDEEEADFPLLSPKDKRLMGIFRCYGWGPGCSDSSFFAPRHNTSPSSSSSSQMTRSRHDDISNPSSYASSSPSSSSSSSSSLQQRTSNANTKFEPFFTLTSGGSWGPTGRKRSGMRRYSVAEKRLNFLKQILRDMLEDTDEDDTGGRSRSLGLRKRSGRSVPNSRTRMFLAEVARLQRAFDRSRSSQWDDDDDEEEELSYVVNSL